ncbi:uncharacterized protein LOC114786738 isoform X2 [Denticeps clupeoides]|uniref:uncharacterized protein LOC114786656 isoform X2 n=1 Tax=Denticeps clupeoides TaxID=299321 RepID=UPI0010A50E01|nr:uncharacterized protein LOC114786656 isoform X2 [Denticeps clupeoides]XP_028829967.1 uncharacterized protein LOC114786738 isoform X2 [Denticeps clupeoides]
MSPRARSVWGLSLAFSSVVPASPGPAEEDMGHRGGSPRGTRLVAACVLLAASNLACVCWVLLLKAKSRTDTACLNGLCSHELTPEILSDIFRNFQKKNSSRAHGILKDFGPLAWEEEWESEKVVLEENGVWITVKEQGWYLVFVQATFQLWKGMAEPADRMNLRLQVDIKFRENSQELFAAFEDKTQMLTNDTLAARLSLPVLLWLSESDGLRVQAKPRKHIVFASSPHSTFLTLFKYSDK